jgi:hypothetical protein
LLSALNWPRQASLWISRKTSASKYSSEYAAISLVLSGTWTQAGNVMAKVTVLAYRNFFFFSKWKKNVGSAGKNRVGRVTLITQFFFFLPKWLNWTTRCLDLPFLRSSGFPFLTVATNMSPAPPAGILLRRPLMPWTAITYKFLAPEHNK